MVSNIKHFVFPFIIQPRQSEKKGYVFDQYVRMYFRPYVLSKLLNGLPDLYDSYVVRQSDSSW